MTNMKASKDMLEVIPAIGQHKVSIIFAHGFGETGLRWHLLGELFHRDHRLRDSKIIIPTAPFKRVTLFEKEGRLTNAWYDIPSWNDIAAGDNDECGMIDARSFFSSIIDKEIASGIPACKIFLGGFSQGGCISLFTGITGRHSLGGVFALSAYLPMIERIEEILFDKGNDRSSKNLPIFLANGNGDPNVKWNWGLRSQEAMARMGFPVEFRTYRGLFHYVCTREFEDLKDWIFDIGESCQRPARSLILDVVKFPFYLPTDILE